MRDTGRTCECCESCGTEVDGVDCCDDPQLVDHWITHKDTETETFRERKKKCETCGQVYPLKVVD